MKTKRIIMGLLILAAAGAGFFIFSSKNTKNDLQKTISSISSETNVLGKSINSTKNTDSNSNSNNSSNNGQIQNTVNRIEGGVSVQLQQIGQNVAASVQKEVGDLTASQVQTLKKQICTDWGIITPSPK